MKRSLLGIALLALVLAGCSTMSPPLGAPPNNQTNNQLFFVNGCATYTPTTNPLNGALCVDTGGNQQVYTWSTTTASFLPSGGASYAAGSTNAVVSNSVESYFPIFGSGTGDVAATIGDASVIMPGVVSIHNLSCATYTILGALTVAGGTSYTFALNKNGTDSALTCVETAALSSCTDTTHTVTTAALDQIEFSDTPSGSPTALVVKCTAQFDGL